MTRSWVAVGWCTAAAADRLHGGNPGFSGGPVLDERTGLVIGMVSSVTSPRAAGPRPGDRYVTPTKQCSTGVSVGR